MALFGRRKRLPDRYRPSLERDERILAWAEVGGDGALVATNRGLWPPRGNGTAGADTEPPARLGWNEIHKATWTGEKLEIIAARVADHGDGYDVVEDLPTIGFPLAEPRELPGEVRARVTRSVGPSTHHPLPGGGGVRVAARRVPGVNGLRWTVRYDPGVDHDDPVVREVTAQLVAQARASVEVTP
ncbi:hypothetical protein [Rugosimonospora africana]|uniref:Uncharacterized protein n=1 Tax=Rugosimonospora africana TaxID=556532 RepID=A0A8J3QVS5_9ACTN|nr:hypothetical protein [Rugosimonospora africana]GIH16942.1 hypothetical protein Raf01_51140 [Rugosimonospora africana]